MAHFAQAKEMSFGHSTIRMVSLKKKENIKIQLKKESGKSIGTMADYSEKAGTNKEKNMACGTTIMKMVSCGIQAPTIQGKKSVFGKLIG